MKRVKFEVETDDGRVIVAEYVTAAKVAALREDPMPLGRFLRALAESPATLWREDMEKT
jgi:hypothetical protein